MCQKSCHLWDNAEKNGRIRQAMDDSIAWHLCMSCWLTTATDTLKICNTYCISTETTVMWTCLIVIFIHSLPLLLALTLHGISWSIQHPCHFIPEVNSFVDEWKILSSGSSSQYQNQLQNIQSTTTALQHKRIQPVTLPILSVFQFFSGVFQFNTDFTYLYSLNQLRIKHNPVNNEISLNTKNMQYL